MCHVRGFTASSSCVSVHMPVASVVPRAQRAHVRALLPVRCVKPREYGSDIPVTTRPEITAKIYSTLWVNRESLLPLSLELFDVLISLCFRFASSFS